MMYDSRTRESDYLFSIHYTFKQLFLKTQRNKKYAYFDKFQLITWLMILDNPNPNDPKKMAGSIDIKEKARRTNDLLTAVESPAIPT